MSNKKFVQIVVTDEGDVICSAMDSDQFVDHWMLPQFGRVAFGASIMAGGLTIGQAFRFMGTEFVSEHWVRVK